MITNKQQLISSFFLSRAIFFGLGITSLLNNTNINSLIIIPLGYILGFILLLFLLNKDYTYFKNNIIGKIISIILCVFIINNSIISFTTLINNFYLIDTPPILIIIPLFFLLLYSVSKGLKTIFKTTELISYIWMFLFVIIFISASKNIYLNNFLPLNINLNSNFFINIMYVALYSICPILLLPILLDNFNKKSILIGYTLGGVSIFLTIVAIIGMLGITLATLYRYPEYIILTKIKLVTFLEKQENFLSLIWYIDLITSILTSGILIKKLTSKKIFYLIVTLSIIATYFIFINNYNNTLFLLHFTGIIILILIIPFILLKKKRTS